MQMDEVLYSIAEKVKNFACIYLVSRLFFHIGAGMMHLDCALCFEEFWWMDMIYNGSKSSTIEVICRIVIAAEINITSLLTVWLSVSFARSSKTGRRRLGQLTMFNHTNKFFEIQCRKVQLSFSII